MNERLAPWEYERARHQGEIAVRSLVELFPTLSPLMEESREDNGQILPHLAMSDIVGWLASHVSLEPEVCRGVLEWMDAQLRDGPEEVQELVVVSGVEMLPAPGESGAELRQMLPAALAQYDSWAHGDSESPRIFQRP